METPPQSTVFSLPPEGHEYESRHHVPNHHCETLDRRIFLSLFGSQNAATAVLFVDTESARQHASNASAYAQRQHSRPTTTEPEKGRRATVNASNTSYSGLHLLPYIILMKHILPIYNAT